MYPINENDYKGDMPTVIYKENGFIEDYKQYTMYTQDEADYSEVKNAKTFKGNLLIADTYKEDVLAATFEAKDVMLMIDNTYKADMLTVSAQGNVVFEKYVQLAMNETANQEVDAKDYMMNNTNLIDNDQDDVQKTNLMYKRGTKDDATRLAVSAIASKRGERGA